MKTVALPPAGLKQAEAASEGFVAETTVWLPRIYV